MPRVIITEESTQGLESCRQFLATKAPQAAKRAAKIIEHQLLETIPDIGRPLPELLELRELVIRFGHSGYVVLYRHEPADDAVYVLAFRHQKEAGCQELQCYSYDPETTN